MGTLRASARLGAVAALTVSFYVLWLAAAIVTLPWPRARVRCRDFCFRHWARSLLRVMGARVTVHGQPPRPPFFLVANHLSYVDILVLAGRLDAVFIAKSEVSGWPIMGLLCRSIGTLFVDRNLRRDLPRVLAEIERILGRGQGLVLFPEGTSTPGIEVGPFRPSLLEVAARAGLPVSYASLSYRTDGGAEPAHRSVCWWGDMELPGHLWRLLALPGFEAALAFGDEPIHQPDRKLLAEQLQRAVGRLFVPVVDRAVDPESA